MQYPQMKVLSIEMTCSTDQWTTEDRIWVWQRGNGLVIVKRGENKLYERISLSAGVLLLSQCVARDGSLILIIPYLEGHSMGRPGFQDKLTMGYKN